jgi:hypothetical protein
MKRSWSRRIEFRRRQKKFLINIKEKIDEYLNRSQNSDGDDVDIEVDVSNEMI